MTDNGCGCKVKTHVCLYCEVNGNMNICDYVVGTKKCKIYISNNCDKCTHHAVNDGTEIERKGGVCIGILLQDFLEKKYIPKAQVIDILPDKEIVCFSGF